MSISSYGSTPFARSAAADLFASMRNQLTDLQRQLDTGKKADTYGGLGFARSSSLDARGKLAALDGYDSAIDQAGLRLKMMTDNLTQLSKLAADTKGDLTVSNFELTDDGRTMAQKNAEQRLMEAIDLLNSDIGGSHLFSGRSVDTKPVETFDHIMNGDGSGRAGLKQLIDERKQAELGATGLGRLGLTSTGTSVQISEEAALPAFGFKIVGATATGSAITASVGAGPPPDANFNLTSIPADGDKITLTLQDQDGNSYNVELTARSGASAGGLTDSFQIGATVADTVANLNAALTTAVQEKATAELAPRAAMQAASDFFAGSPSNPPQRVDGPPFTSATGMVAGTAANTMIWYTGDDTAASPRATMPVRIDDNQTVSTGAQANEPAIQNILAQLGVLAAETFTDTPQDKARYNTLTDQIAGNLASGGSGPKVEDIAAELASSNTAMQAAKGRHTDTQKMLQDTLDSNELANPDEVGVSILALQTRLQASYQTTSMLSQLSLVNFL